MQKDEEKEFSAEELEIVELPEREAMKHLLHIPGILTIL